MKRLVFKQIIQNKKNKRRKASLKILVTGGAGFIGSRLTEILVNKGYDITVFDSLISGHKQNLNTLLKKPNFNFIKGDCRNPQDISKALEDIETVFHFAASSDICLDIADTKKCYEQNIISTYTLLEEVRKSKHVRDIVFASTSAVYGDVSVVPTPESYAPLKPISVYGATKLACEALVSSYSNSFGMRAIIFRPANVVGPKCSHGVVYDFVKKLKTNSSHLEILGDGTQSKSYLHVDDCVGAIIKAFEFDGDCVEIFNVGADDQVSVAEIGEIVVEEMGLDGVEFRFSGGVDGGRGWIGDVKNMLLETSRIKSLGWRPKLSSKDAIKLTVKEMIKNRDTQ